MFALKGNKMARALMLQGTGSDVGKTVLAAGLCRLARNRGIKVAPFKPQNMSNNAAVAADGGEIGRGQWLQAVAAGVAPSVHMNPVLLKPQSESGSQIIVQGRVYGQAQGYAYQRLKAQLLGRVMQSYRHVCAQADLVIAEGAGSPAEINLRGSDIANMGFARAADVPVILVGDIDRGGVIASLAGTHAVLAQEDRRMICGYIINKFRGDSALFDSGLAAIENFTGWRSFGVVPWLADAALLPAEDSCMLERFSVSGRRRIRIAVPLSSRIANFDDLDPLKHEADVELLFIKCGEAFPQADVILLAGSKATLADMQEFHACGWSDAVRRHARMGGRVVGLCGGFQMLGRTIRDPSGQEGALREIPGLGLLDVETVMQEQKILRNVTGYAPFLDTQVSGYEIHLGRTCGPDCARAPLVIEGRPDGAASPDGRIWGAYLHGIFSGGGFRRRFLQMLGGDSDGRAHHEKIDEALERIAAILEKTIDADAVFALAR